MSSTAILDALDEMPEGCLKCSCCGALAPTIEGRGADHPRVLFDIRGCVNCGHIMRKIDGCVRDLTRAEAAELEACPDFGQMRSVIDKAIRNLWG